MIDKTKKQKKCYRLFKAFPEGEREGGRERRGEREGKEIYNIVSIIIIIMTTKNLLIHTHTQK